MDYIYGKLCQKVKEVEYSGGTTDTIQVNIDQDTNVITADYIGEQGDVTKEYVDQQIAGLSTEYLSLNGGTMSGALVLENEGYSTTIDGQHITIEDDGTEVLSIDSGSVTAGYVQAKEIRGYNSEDNATVATFNGVSIGHIQDSSAEDRAYDIGKSSTLEIQTPLIEIGKNNEGVREDIRITGVATPTNDNDAVNKKYVDDNSGGQKLYQHNIIIKTINYTTQAYVGVIISNSSVPFDSESLWQYLYDHNFNNSSKLLGVTGYDAVNKRVGIGIYYNSSAGTHVPWFLYGTIDNTSLSNESALVANDVVVEI